MKWSSIECQRSRTSDTRRSRKGGVNGVWLGHAQHTPEAIIATDTGIVKAYAVRRQPRGQQWDGDKIRSIRGSPTDWKLDATEDQVEQEDRGKVGLDPGLESRVGSRTGERISMYLSKKDFADHGYTGGCTGCRDLASGKRKQIAPHTIACRRRMEAAVRERDPDRWERFLLRRRQE